METFEGYIIMKQFKSGSKSDGYYAHLYIGPSRVYKLYRAEVLPIHDTYFNQFHLKPVKVQGILHPRHRSINVGTVEIVNDSFLPSNEESDSTLNEQD